MSMDVHYSSGDNIGRYDWNTPKHIIDKLEDEFGRFQLDPCANSKSHHGEYWLTEEEDGLKYDWTAYSSVYMNPPYGKEIGKWVEKAMNTAKDSETKVVCLLPARTDTRWWHDFVTKAKEIRFLKGRVKFGGSKTGAPFPSAIVIFDGVGGGGTTD